jgi:hypothetical protein
MEACAEQHWNRDRIADALNISVATLYRRLKLAGLSLRRITPTAAGAGDETNGANRSGSLGVS